MDENLSYCGCYTCDNNRVDILDSYQLPFIKVAKSFEKESTAFDTKQDRLDQLTEDKVLKEGGKIKNFDITELKKKTWKIINQRLTISTQP